MSKTPDEHVWHTDASGQPVTEADIQASADDFSRIFAEDRAARTGNVYGRTTDGKPITEEVVEEFARWFEENNERIAAEGDAAREARSVLYELTMMRCAAPLVNKRITPEPNYSLFLEAFLLHVRNLLDFVLPRPNAHATDITAKGLCAAWTEDETFWKATTSVAETRRLLDKHLSHLTEDRLGGKPQWNVRDLVHAIDQCFDAFLAACTTDERAVFET